MTRHTITATLLYVVIRCGGCGKTWEQPNTPPDDPGTNVCPLCLHAAPTKSQRSAA